MASNWPREHTHRIMLPGRSRHTPSSAFERYLDWRRQSSTCEVAYRRWATAGSSRDGATAFAAYTAALDREEQAAALYEAAVSGG